jgi:hypothetical protein
MSASAGRQEARAAALNAPKSTTERLKSSAVLAHEI